MDFTRLHHVSVNVDDLAAARAFYVDVLGFETLDRPDIGVPGVWLDAGDQQVHLIEVPGARAPDGQHFALRVDDLEAAIAELERRDVRVSPITVLDRVGRQAFFRDPAGNLIEFNQPN